MRKKKIPTIKNGIKDVEEWLGAKGNEDIYRELLGDKAPRRTEVEVSFFQKCNLKCAFCWQDHDDEDGTDDIPGKADVVISYLKSWKHIKDDVTVTMTGGELFQNNVDYYKQYYDFMYKVKDFRPSTNFTLITNLSFNDDTASQVEALISRCRESDIKVSMSTSWDLVGRPINDQFYLNLVRFRKEILGITFILTKPGIKGLLSGNYNKNFDMLYGNYPIDFDYYVPTEYANILMPSDKDLLDAFRFFVEKYPNLGTVESWIKGENNMMTCGNMNKITVLPDSSIVPCRQLDYDDSDFKTPINKSTNVNMVEKHMNKYNCLSCEFYSKCTMTCFVMNDHVSYKEELDDCLYRILFKELDGSNNKAN